MWIANTEDLPCNPQTLVGALQGRPWLERLALIQASSLTPFERQLGWRPFLNSPCNLSPQMSVLGPDQTRSHDSIWPYCCLRPNALGASTFGSSLVVLARKSQPALKQHDPPVPTVDRLTLEFRLSNRSSPLSERLIRWKAFGRALQQIDHNVRRLWRERLDWIVLVMLAPMSTRSG